MNKCKFLFVLSCYVFMASTAYTSPDILSGAGAQLVEHTSQALGIKVMLIILACLAYFMFKQEE